MLKLKQIRVEKKMTVKQLSEQSGVPVRTIEDIERRGDCTVSRLHKLSQVLNVSLDELYSNN